MINMRVALQLTNELTACPPRPDVPLAPRVAEPKIKEYEKPKVDAVQPTPVDQ
jgi:hypothetical protein